MPASDPNVRSSVGGLLSGPCLNPDELPSGNLVHRSTGPI
jgi:hypothetical protein